MRKKPKGSFEKWVESDKGTAIFFGVCVPVLIVVLASVGAFVESRDLKVFWLLLVIPFLPLIPISMALVLFLTKKKKK